MTPLVFVKTLIFQLHLTLLLWYLFISLGILSSPFYYTFTAESKPFSLYLRVKLQHLFFCVATFALLQTFHARQSYKCMWSLSYTCLTFPIVICSGNVVLTLLTVVTPPDVKSSSLTLCMQSSFYIYGS